MNYRKPIVWIDDHEATWDDFLIDARITLAGRIELEAKTHEADGEPVGKIISRELRSLAARIRASGCRTPDEWLARFGPPEPEAV